MNSDSAIVPCQPQHATIFRTDTHARCDRDRHGAVLLSQTRCTTTMAFHFSDSWINHYWSLGYVVFPRIVPPSLLHDLRVEADKARILARALHGPQAQRLQPVNKYKDQINDAPFRDYNELPVLRDAIQRLLGPSSYGATVIHTTPARLGLLIEPGVRPRHFGWHRDTVVEVPLARQREPARVSALAKRWYSPIVGNQVNCAIYPDPCLWYVPGSHARSHDLHGEKQSFCYHTGENPWDKIEATHVELEALHLEAAYSFPGAIRVHLDPGDFLIYRNLGWHTGVYTTHTPRATIHDAIDYQWSSSVWQKFTNHSACQ
jgi:hypothetical protein